MSIDARISRVEHNEDGTAYLHLEPCHDEPAGQSRMQVLNPPANLDLYEGVRIWGGSGYVLVQDRIVADRVGYTRLRWRDN